MANKLYNEQSVQAIADAIRSVSGSTDTYKISEMAAAVAGISTGLDWAELGYDTTGSDKGLPAEIKSAFDYAKYIYDNWEELRELSVPKYTNNKKMFLFPNVDITETTVYNSMFDGSNLMHIEPIIIGEETPTIYINCSTMFKNTWIENVNVTTKTSTQRVDSNNMFIGCNNLITCELNFVSTNVTSMFATCRSLTTITGNFDTSNATSFATAFEDCNVLENVPDIDTGSGTTFYRCFHNCNALKNAPAWDLSSAQNVSQMFWQDAALENIPVYDLSSVTNLQNMFQNTGTNITNDSLNNILASCISATSYTGTKSLAYIGLSSTYDAIIPTLSNYNDFLTAGWIIR